MSRARHLLPVWSVAVLVLIGGCAELPFSAAARLREGSATAFELLGRVYVRFGQRAFTGSLRWQHAREADEVWLAGPLGQTAAHILRDAAGATLTSADQQVFRAFSLDALTRDGLGWTLPLADLSHYVLGNLPPLAQAVPGRDRGGRLQDLEHEGWRVRWVHRENATAGATPGRIELRKDDVEIRLVVDRLDRAIP